MNRLESDELKQRPHRVISSKYVEFALDKATEKFIMVEISEERKRKLDNKLSTLRMPERIFILDNFTPELII